MTQRQAHWEHVYATKDENEVSWFEPAPDLSLALLRDAGLMPDDAVIDVGGGASHLVDTLLAAGQAHVAVLDLSAAALETARRRLAGNPSVDWIVADITTWTPYRHYDLWHDRAAFHFLTAPDEQRAYADALAAALPPGGTAVIGTVALDGPEKCSGLPVARYDAEGMARTLGNRFAMLNHQRHTHVTPWDATQAFQFVTFERRPDR